MAGRVNGRSDLVVRIFARLGRWVVRHPWQPVAFWIGLLVVTIPFLPLLGSVTTNSTTTIATSAPSQVANALYDELFPNATGASSTTLLFYGTNLTDLSSQRAVMNVTAALGEDRSLAAVQSIASVYTEYASYLAGEAELTGAFVKGALAESPPLPVGVNQTAALLWGTPALFVNEWQTLILNTSEPPSYWNYPAFEATAAALNSSTAALAVLDAFYAGAGASGAGFNGSAACAAAPSTVVACSTSVARANEASLIPVLFPVPTEQAVPRTVLGTLDLMNFTQWGPVRSVSSVILGESVGLPPAWVDRVWSEFPGGAVAPVAADAWANATVANSTLWSEPLPVPYGIFGQFVNDAGTAQLIQVTFSVSDDATNASGGSPVYADLGHIDSVVTATLAASDPSASISYAQTGGAALDKLTQEAVNSSIALVLPLTVGLLLVIAMVYFRSPLTPLVTFAALGIALTIGIGGTILIGTFVTKVDTTSLTLVEVFVLGVGTDYSIFLAARYREELVAGRSSDEALVNAVSWAGQSIATSGSTAIIATAALALSGIALLSQWGMALSLAVFITLVLSLTLLPAFLKLIGPRVFWPYTRERFIRHATRVSQRQKEGRTYFYRVGSWTARRPGTVVATILVVTIPLAAIALTVPLAYDFYGQLPSGHPATDGLSTLGNEFGPGFATPSFALVTFASPLVVQNVTNATEFTDIASLTVTAEGTGGIAKVSSPVGPSGASLSQWLSLGTLPVATRTNLLATLSGFVGTDGRTVLFGLQTNSTGLSLGAVQAVQSVESSFGSYKSSHPEIKELSYGGGAPVISDLAQETAVATDYMILAVTVGLIGVLLFVLRSWIIAVMAIATIGLSISWAWALTYLLFQQLLGFPLFFFVRTILFILILGLGIDYNIFLLTRVREERVKGRSSREAAFEAVGRTGGIITAAAVILASAFAAVTVGEFTLIRAIGFSVAVAVLLDAMVVRTYLVPASLQLLGDRVWTLTGRRPKPTPAEASPADGPAPPAADPGATTP